MHAMLEGIKALFRSSPLTFLLSFTLIGLSMIDVFVTQKWWKEKWQKIAIAVISVALLIVQTLSSGRAAQQEDAKLTRQRTDLTTAFGEQLAEQQKDLTVAFQEGTNQVIKAAGQTADETRKSAKQQTEAIRQQAARQFTQLQGATLGTSTCPSVVLGNPTGGRPNQIAVVNFDPVLNMYEVRLEVTEYGPTEPGGPWSTILQYQVVNFPQIIRHWASVAPFVFLSKMTDIHVEFRLTTKTANCAGSVYLFYTGKNHWMTDRETITQDGKPLTQYYQGLSPGLAASKPEPE